MSTLLDSDESSAYHRLRQEARALGTIARSFDDLAVSTTSAYLTALTRSTREAWIALVNHAALLVLRAHELDGVVVLNAGERSAVDFFEAIVRENADLLDAPAAIPGSLAIDISHRTQTPDGVLHIEPRNRRRDCIGAH